MGYRSCCCGGQDRGEKKDSGQIAAKHREKSQRGMIEDLKERVPSMLGGWQIHLNLVSWMLEGADASRLSIKRSSIRET